MSKKRLQVEFTGEALEELDQLQKLAGLSTRSELIRQALRFLQWGLDETMEKGSSLLIERDGQIREMVFPFWRGPQKSARSKKGKTVAMVG